MKKFKKYPAYKDSGIDWIGEIPKHWEVRKLKHLGFIYSGLSGKSSSDFYTENTGQTNKPYIPFANIYNNDIIDVSKYDYVSIVSREKQNKVKNKDLLFLMSSETYEDIAKSAIYLGCDKELYLNSFCKGFRIVKRGQVNPLFVNYLLKASIYRIYFESTARGFTRINIRQTYINDTSIILPPLSEQKKIASFLDKKMAEIDKAIELKQKENELLKERRQIAINQSVTRGLHPNVEYKDSGIDWIGEIPEHWEVRKAKWLFKKENRLTRKADEVITCFRDGEVTLRKNRRVEGFTNSLKEIGYQGIRKGDLVIHAMDAFAGAIGVSDSDGKGTPVYSVCTPIIESISNYFYAYLLRYMSSKKYIEALAKGIRERSTDFRFTEFAKLALPLPPLSEQKEIAEYLEELDSKTNRLLELNNRAIAKLKEYKQVLIDQAVRGQICLV